MFNYIDYEGLKDALRAHRAWDDAAEQRFVEKLEQELQKVFSFNRVKSEEIIRRIAASEREVNEVIARQEQTEGSADEQALEDDFALLEEDLSDIIADVHDLAKYTQLNYTGFQKIIKKHDVSASHAWCPPLHWARG